MQIKDLGATWDTQTEMRLRLNRDIAVSCSSMEEVKEVIRTWKDRGWKIEDPHLIRKTTTTTVQNDRVDFEDGEL
jgi:hypothetical protein